LFCPAGGNTHPFPESLVGKNWNFHYTAILSSESGELTVIVFITHEASLGFLLRLLTKMEVVIKLAADLPVGVFWNLPGGGLDHAHV
jgi:hypothetical protein